MSNQVGGKTMPQEMDDLQQLEEFVSQIAKPEQSIKCTPDGISFEEFAKVCDLPGAPDDAKQLLQSSISLLRQATLSEDEQIKNIAIILRLLIENLSSFVTLEQYSWLVHTVAKSLVDDISLNGGNLLHVIKMLATGSSPILYYIAVALVFAGLNAITHSGKAVESYRVHGMSEFLRHLEICNLPYLQQQCDNLQTIYQLLKLLSLYQNMVILRHGGKSWEDLSEEHKGFAESFHIANAQIQTFRKWLDNVSAIVQPFGKDQEKDYLILADLLQVDMIPLFDDLSPDDELV
uniref:Uncharacterized protein n=1 Tax=Anopheles culicifacies TaxID=139723 RepID=A0A182M502_9DIPT